MISGRTSLLRETLEGVRIHDFNCYAGRDLSTWPPHWRWTCVCVITRRGNSEESRIGRHGEELRASPLLGHHGLLHPYIQRRARGGILRALMLGR